MVPVGSNFVASRNTHKLVMEPRHDGRPRYVAYHLLGSGRSIPLIVYLSTKKKLTRRLDAAIKVRSRCQRPLSWPAISFRIKSLVYLEI